MERHDRGGAKGGAAVVLRFNGVKPRLIVALLSAYMIAATAVAEVPARVLSPADEPIVKSALEAAAKGQWAQSRTFSAKLHDPVAKKLMRWLDYTRSDSAVNFSEIAAFLEANPTWPEISTLRRRAEESMPLSLTAAEVLAWFKKYEPVSSTGWTRYAEALVASGRADMGHAVIRETWIEGNFSQKDEKSFYNRHKKLLTREDHAQRLDRLIWAGRYDSARAMLPKVSPEYRQLAETRLMLMRMQGNVDKALTKIPASLQNDPGLNYERLRWRRRKGMVDGAISILRAPHDESKYPQKWWVERSALAREALEKGNISEAYRIASSHSLSDGAGFADAEWLSGWIALRFLNDTDVALRHFKALYAAVEMPVSRSRGAYWVARAEDARGDKEQALHWYELAAAHPTTYYGQLAHDVLHPGKGIDIPADPVADRDEVKAFEKHELVRAARMLGGAGKANDIRPFVLRLADMGETAGWRALAASLARSYGRPDLGIIVAKRVNRSGMLLIEDGYPIGDSWLRRGDAAKGRVELPLVLAVIRQESAFRPEAVSTAGAQGLMQLMPATAASVAKSLRLPYTAKKLVADPAFNLALGRAHLGDLIDDFSGSYVLALVAYNAGPSRARQWVKLYGHPSDKAVDAVDWIEMIPFSETRNYVQRVLENLRVYRKRLGETEVASTMASDLSR